MLCYCNKYIVMQYDCYVTMEMQQTHYYTTVTITWLWKCNILIVTQQELLRHYGNAIWCINHVTTENVICHNMVYPVTWHSIVIDLWITLYKPNCSVNDYLRHIFYSLYKNEKSQCVITVDDSQSQQSFCEVLRSCLDAVTTYNSVTHPYLMCTARVPQSRRHVARTPAEPKELPSVYNHIIQQTSLLKALS
jgi:hypothetical protein